MTYPIMAMDLGLKRIGVALCVAGDMVTPLPAVLRKNRDQAASEMKVLLDTWNIQTLVVGIPIGGESEDEMRRRMTHFLGLLHFSGAVVYQDESESSIEAKTQMQGVMRQVRDGRIDSLSAKIILERALRENT